MFRQILIDDELYPLKFVHMYIHTYVHKYEINLNPHSLAPTPFSKRNEKKKKERSEVREQDRRNFEEGEGGRQKRTRRYIVENKR